MVGSNPQSSTIRTPGSRTWRVAAIATSFLPGLFTGARTRVHIWRTNSDGSNPAQLTNGAFDRFPVCSPDGKWVYYYDGAGPHYPKRVPLEGGQPEPVPASDVHGMYGFGAGEAISPDGKLLIFNADVNSADNSPGAVSRLALVTLD